jgi:glycosyltransferase involved in cell wall biosynthesis
MKFRILFLKNSLFIPELYAGTELTTHFLCRSLIERGHIVAVAASSNRPEFDVDQPSKCDDVCSYPVYRARRFEDAAATSIAEFRPDVVVCQEPGYWIGSDKLDGLRGMAVVLYQHAMYHGITDVPAPIRERAVYLANSVPTSAFLKTTHGIDSIIVPPVFGIDRFAALERHGSSVLAVGITLGKGADIAIEIARERPNVSFVFVESWTENPNETAQLRRLIASLLNAKLLPNQPGLRRVFQTTRLLLMPSRVHEGWGRTATEAQLCGIPVLGSSRGQLGSTIGPGGIALDPDAGISIWLQAFDSIWNDAEHYRVLSCRAKDHAARLIDEKDAVEQFENCLAETLLRSMRLALRRNAEAQARCGEVQAKLVRKEAEAAEVQAKLVCKEAEAAEAQAKLVCKEAEAASLSADNWHLRCKLAEIEQSTSWRMTKPVRQIVEILRARTTRIRRRA